MKQKILYIFLTIVATFCYSLEAGAENVETRTITINGTLLKNITNKYLIYNDSEFGEVKFGNGATSISYNDANTDYIELGNSSATFNLTFTGGIFSNSNYVVNVTEVLVRMSQYGIGGTSPTLTSTSTQTSKSTNVNTAGLNRGNDNYYKDISISGSNLGTAYTIKVDGTTGGYWINKFVITYTKEKLHNVTIANNIDAVTTTIKAGVKTTASITADDKTGYEFVSWNLPSSGVTLANNTTINNKTIQINATEDGKNITAIYKPVFKFEASAISSNTEYGTVTASVDAATVLGETPESTSASTTARFNANPASGCTFNGWYENSSYSGDPVSTDASYSVTITNNDKSSPYTKTLYAKFKKNQTLSWENPSPELNLVKGTSSTDNKAVSSEGLTVSYTSSNTSAVTVDTDGTLHAIDIGESTITASQAGDDNHNPATSISRKFTVSEKLQPVFTPSFDGLSPIMLVDQSATITLENVSEGLAGDFTATTSTGGIVDIQRNANTLTITARPLPVDTESASTVLTLRQAGSATTEETSQSYTITVNKHTNTLTTTLPSTELFVDGTAIVEFGNQNNTADIDFNISDVVLEEGVEHQSGGVISYNPETRTITALNSGTAKISFSQAATGKYKVYQSEAFEIEVKKYYNSLIIKIDGTERTAINLGHNADVGISVTSAHNDKPYTFTITSGDGSMGAIGGGHLTTGTTDGTMIWLVSQAETYKYTAATSYLRVKINSVPEEEGYVYQGWTDGNEFSWSTISGTSALALDGPGEIFSFQAKATAIAGFWNSSNFYAQYSVDGGKNWIRALTINLASRDQWYDFSCEIPENATHVRLLTETGATGNKQVCNIRVTRKTYVRASASRLDFGDVYAGQKPSIPFNVSYSTTNGGNIEITSSNPRFTVDNSDIDVRARLMGMTDPLADPHSIDVNDHSDNKVTVNLTYNPDPSAKMGEDETTITISDRYYTAELHFRANVVKGVATIDSELEAGNLTEMKVEDAITDVFTFNGTSEALPSADNEDSFHFTIAHTPASSASGSAEPEKVIAYDPAANTITALNAGTARLTVYQEATDLVYAKTVSYDFSVSRHNQTISWDKEIATILQLGTKVTDNTASASTELPVTYASGNESAISVDSQSGELNAIAVGSGIIITASQQGNYKYNPASISRTFSVINKKTPSFTPDSHFEGNTATINFREKATITLSGVGEDEDTGFTFSGYDSSVINIERGGEDNEILIITALEIGNTTLTLAQAANDDFLGKSETYTINVVMPSDYLTLDPTAGFELAEGGEYSKVFLHRTIPAGLNTIALPFNTTASALGAQKAYTFVNVGVKEGAYYFYFKELESDATMLAGVPYVILCENTISEKVISDTDGISVSSTEELQRVGTVNCGQWSFVANFSAGEDGSGIDMNGKHGVVNSAEPKRNEIMLGGEGSKLQAYTAYFILNQASQSSYTSGTPASTKVASADIPAGAIPLFSIKE